MRNPDPGAIRPGAEAIDLRKSGTQGALLLHGFGDTPQTLRLLALRLHSDGYSVRAPLLPGHGRTMREFSSSTADDWIGAARDAMAQMRGEAPSVALVGLSMGGALAAIVASEVADTPALALLSPYLAMPRHLMMAASTHGIWGRYAGEMRSRHPLSILDPVERERNLGYGTVTGSALYQLLRVVRIAKAALSAVHAPTLLIQSRQDPRCTERTARRSLAEIAARDKKLVMTEGAGHVITVDHGRERVFDEISAWLTTHGPQGAAAAQD